MGLHEYEFQLIDKMEKSFLEDMLYCAIFVGEGEPPSRDIIYRPDLYKYIKNWDEDKDIGYMIIDKEKRNKLGAVWIRTFDGHKKGYGYIDEDVPELSIALYPEYRGKGLGTALLNHLISNLPPRINSISLSVDIRNPAKKLYEGIGFKEYSIDDGTVIMIYAK